MTEEATVVRNASLVDECSLAALVLPDISDLDRYIVALEWRRAVIERVATFEEQVAKEKEHRSKVAFLDHLLAHCEHWQETEPWKVLETEAKRDGALAAARKCRMMIDQMEREARAFILRLKILANGQST